MKIHTIAVAALITCLSVFASATSDHSSVHIMKPWARASAPGAPSAGFMMVKNSGSEEDVLLSVSGDFGKKLEVHQSKMVDGIMKMAHQKDGVVIPAGGMVEFKPGSYHLMFMGLEKPFVKGETYTVVLEFKHAGSMEVVLPVMDMPKAGEMKH